MNSVHRLQRTAYRVWQLFADTGQTRYPLGRWGVPVDVRHRQFEQGVFVYDHSCEYRKMPIQKKLVRTLPVKHSRTGARKWWY